MAKYIRASRKMNYGPPNVTSKYSPLENISFAETDAGYCDDILMRRWKVLNFLGILPRPLALVLPNWATAVTSEQKARQKPPLVVISSNRSNWIKKGIDTGGLQLEALGSAQFDNASDLRALDLTDLNALLGKTHPSPPMYCPSRIGAAAGPRNVYVVVHANEYLTYKTNLAGTGITVVGWMFQKPRPDEMLLCGFGASRFAAIEFCKTLRTRAGNPWDYAWLFDDNVVAFTSFAGYLKVEAAMASGPTDPATGRPRPYICAGFSGGSTTISPIENTEWAKKELKEGKRDGIRGKEYAALPAVKKKGLIQQAALWNIAELTRLNLNFGPIFVNSGEDVSLGNYFNVKNKDEAKPKMPYLFYESISIRKEDTGDDSSPGARVVQKARETISALFAESERFDPRPFQDYLDFPPPLMIKPIKIDPKDPATETEQTLAHFVVKTVLPHTSSTIQKKAKEKQTKDTGMCHAAEQTICKAIELERVEETTLNQTFKINGDTPQDIVPSDKP